MCARLRRAQEPCNGEGALEGLEVTYDTPHHIASMCLLLSRPISSLCPHQHVVLPYAFSSSHVPPMLPTTAIQITPSSVLQCP